MFRIDQTRQHRQFNSEFTVVKTSRHPGSNSPVLNKLIEIYTEKSSPQARNHSQQQYHRNKQINLNYTPQVRSNQSYTPVQSRNLSIRQTTDTQRENEEKAQRLTTQTKQFWPNTSREYQVDTTILRPMTKSGKPVAIKIPVSDVVYLLKPIYQGRDPTIFFQYLPQCNLPPRSMTRVISRLGEIGELQFKIADNVNAYNAVCNAFKFAGIPQTNSSNFNVLISRPPNPKQLREMKYYQKINHFPGSWMLGKKDLLWECISRMRKRHKAAYNIAPKTFILPDDYEDFEQDRQMHPNNLWIFKPTNASCGRGIKVIDSQQNVQNRQGHLISRYLKNPHLINGFKYDLRIYVCVTSYDPLKIYMYKDGLVRLATEKYNTDQKNIAKRYIHLTNYSVNKKSQQYVYNVDSSNNMQGSKWNLTALKDYFLGNGIEYYKVMRRIQDIIIKTCISAEPYIVQDYNNSAKYKNICYQTYGFDVIIDSNLKPWILEVNIFPSLSSSSPMDKRIKTSLMCDVYNLIGIPNCNKHTPISQQKLQILKNRRKQVKDIDDYDNLDDYRISEAEFDIILDYEEEYYRKGQFKRIYPKKRN